MGDPASYLVTDSFVLEALYFSHVTCGGCIGFQLAVQCFHESSGSMMMSDTLEVCGHELDPLSESGVVDLFGVVMDQCILKEIHF